MPSDDSFADLVRRVRAGDQEAAAELVRRYEPAIRRAVRIHLRDDRLRRVLDSTDVSQSVLGNFFVRAALGEFEIESPADLLGLLTTMARNKVATIARRPQVARRDYRGLDAAGADGDSLLARDADPSRQAAGRDMLQAVRDRLTAEERTLAEQRAMGLGWAEIAAAGGGSAEGLRKKLARGLGRVVRELGLDGDVCD